LYWPGTTLAVDTNYCKQRSESPQQELAFCGVVASGYEGELTAGIAREQDLHVYNRDMYLSPSDRISSCKENKMNKSHVTRLNAQSRLPRQASLSFIVAAL